PGRNGDVRIVQRSVPELSQLIAPGAVLGAVRHFHARVFAAVARLGWSDARDGGDLTRVADLERGVGRGNRDGGLRGRGGSDHEGSEGKRKICQTAVASAHDGVSRNRPL